MKNKEEKKTISKFRYFCHGCTKAVYYSESPEPGKSVTCPHCGKVQTTVSENYITL